MTEIPRSDERELWPRWLRNLDQALAVNSQFILSGNIRDRYLMPVSPFPESDARSRASPSRDHRTVIECLWHALSRSGYEFLVVLDPVDGLGIVPGDPAPPDAAREVLGDQSKRDSREVDLERLEALLSMVCASPRRRAAFVIDYASRLQILEGRWERFLAFAEKLSHTAAPLRVDSARPGPLYNPVIWLLNRDRDLPEWLTVGNEAIRSIPVPLPDRDDRLEAARILARVFPGSRELLPPEDEHVGTFANVSDGLTLHGMVEATRLARDRGIPFSSIGDAVRSYKVGILDQPWTQEILVREIAEASASIPKRIFGQDAAVARALEILKRSVVGLSGAQAAHGAARPRGVLFFAGPTGVGKTELARQLTRTIFGDERAYVRFDMSEFSEEHSAARLIGAPPGYVGHDAGGELTDALRRRPFSLILFDEIEKAHPRIMDKFLQILEDGRLTDGRGETAHFSEAILVFTSNLGMYVEEEEVESREDLPPELWSVVRRRVPNVTPDMPPDTVQERIRREIERVFKEDWNRPELLNRFGGNIVVFNFIDRPTATRIFQILLQHVCRNFQRARGIPLEIGPEARAALLEWCIRDLSNGGRGIGNELELALVNPLSSAIFQRLGQDGTLGERVAVRAVHPAEAGHRVEIR